MDDRSQKATLYSSNGVSTPTQWGGLAAFEIDAATQEKITEEYRRRRDLLLSGLNELGFTCDPPAGAFYAFPDASRISRDSQEAADILLNQAKVATVPGIVFGPDGQSHLRFPSRLQLRPSKPVSIHFAANSDEG